jgi:hypothetical protein
MAGRRHTCAACLGAGASGHWARLAQVGVHIVLAGHLAALLLVPAVHGARRLPPVHARLPLRLGRLALAALQHSTHNKSVQPALSHAIIALADKAHHQVWLSARRSLATCMNTATCTHTAAVTCAHKRAAWAALPPHLRQRVVVLAQHREAVHVDEALLALAPAARPELGRDVLPHGRQQRLPSPHLVEHGPRPDTVLSINGAAATGCMRRTCSLHQTPSGTRRQPMVTGERTGAGRTLTERASV